MARCYLCNMPCLRHGARCHPCSRAAIGPKKATLYQCRHGCGTSCTKKGGQCRKCSEAARPDTVDEVIGTCQHPPIQEWFPGQNAWLELLHRRAKARKSLAPKPGAMMRFSLLWQAKHAAAS